jgi:hypothetical protein
MKTEIIVYYYAKYENVLSIEFGRKVRQFRKHLLRPSTNGRGTFHLNVGTHHRTTLRNGEKT